ncbi:disintegrin and metalloproteinase domain-containing protein 12-like [Amphiura filiformis]|uniref:disintegrin and metalloproteinase domain-containing protein 12-like n=1 Tax=Amphiura filiformis TaxID=82378 RepID=UPI003B215DF0
MWINENLFPGHFVESSYLPDGKKLHRKPHETHHCYYHGSVRGIEDSNVALSTCNGLSGIIFLNGTSFYIEPLQNSSAEHLVYNAANVNRPKQKCSQDYGVHIDSLYSLPEQSTDHNRRRKRDVHTEMKHVELFIVNDYAEFLDIGGIQECVSRSKEMANIMDVIYKQLNIRVALVGVEVWNEGDPIRVSTNPETTLMEFQKWRKDELIKETLVYNDNAQLVTGKSLEGTTVGIASLGAMCSYQRSAGVNQDHGEHAADVSSTMSHEMGHNLGFQHDTYICQCTGKDIGGCIMQPVSGFPPPTVFSSCSIDYLSSSLERGIGACLFNYPSDIFGGPVCGNGFHEDGEECDCGTVESCDNECCAPETCTLRVNATCAEGECCEDCQLTPAATLCRDRMNNCDLPEYCTGRSNECPSNVYIQNGKPCANKDSEDSMCFDGQCVTYTQQCERLWGKNSKGAEPDCYTYWNTRGSSFGNCGYTKDATGEDIFFPCKKGYVKDFFFLMCIGGGDYPIAGQLKSGATGYVNVNGKELQCKAASIDLGQDVPDPGYVVDGSPCGRGKVCMDSKCLNLTELHIQQCPYNCHGNGVCNSNNRCHCDDDWAPPLCNTPGNGGSMDSGPPTPPRDRGSSATTVALLILFLVVLPLLGLVAIVSYLKRNELKSRLCKPRQKQPQYHPESSSMNEQRATSPSTGRSQPSISEHQIQHHNNRLEFHDRPSPQRPVLPSKISPNSGGSLSSMLPPQRPSIQPSQTSSKGGDLKPLPLRPPGLLSKTNEGTAAPRAAVKPPKQALKPPGRSNLSH